MKTQILKDTDYSFIKTITNKEGREFDRKLEKGTSEYSNACSLFHQKGVEIKKGNKIILI